MKLPEENGGRQWNAKGLFECDPKSTVYQSKNRQMGLY